eukprot:5146109-Prymnesium_polylepis.1
MAGCGGGRRERQPLQSDRRPGLRLGLAETLSTKCMGSDSWPPGPNPQRSSFSRLAGEGGAARRSLVCARRSAGLACVVWGCVFVARVPSPPVVPCPCLPASPCP